MVQSKRVHFDLKTWLTSIRNHSNDHHHNHNDHDNDDINVNNQSSSSGHYYEMNIIIREWNYIDPSMEFRAFVHDGKLTAVSQYITVCYFENLVKHKKEIQQKIGKFFEEIREPLSKRYRSYVIDFGIVDDELRHHDEDDHEQVVKVIEINPFWHYAGPSLMNWEEDRDIIATGKDTLNGNSDDNSFVFFASWSTSGCAKEILH